MKTQFLTLLFFVPFLSFGQDLEKAKSYYREIANAKTVSKAGFKDSAIVLYEQAFQKIDYVSFYYIKEVLDLSKSVKDKDRVRKYKALWNQKRESIDKDFKSKVDSLNKWEDKIRTGKIRKGVKFYNTCMNDSLCDRQSKKFLEAKRLYDLAINIGRSNQKAVLKLITDKGGYKGELLLGKHHYSFFKDLLHCDDDTNNVILKPILDEAFSRGLVSPVLYSSLLDRHEYSTMGTQKYWAWPYVDKDPELTKEEIEKANFERSQIGINSKIKEIRHSGKDWIIVNY
jgi:hypothetical protein